MLKRLSRAAAACIGLVLTLPATSAEAGDFGHSRHGHEARGFALVPPVYYPPSYYRTFYAPPVTLYGYGYVYKPVSSTVQCGWVKRRAINTQSPSWWARYHRCRGL